MKHSPTVVAESSDPAFSTWLPLIAALIALVAALAVALYNSTSQALQSARGSVRERVGNVRARLGELQASRTAMTFGGYPGWDQEDIDRLDKIAKDEFWDNYRQATFNARAALASLDSDNPTIKEVVAGGEPQISPEVTEKLLVALREHEENELRKLTKWWVPKVG